MSWYEQVGNLAFSTIEIANEWASKNLVYDGLLATAGGSAVVWRSGAWVGVNDNIQLRSSLTSGVNIWDGVENNPGNYIDNDGSIKSTAGYAISNYFPVTPGEFLYICNGQAGLDKTGGFYLGTTWLSPIGGVGGKRIVVPAGCDAIRITTRMANQSDYVPVYIYRASQFCTATTYRSVSSIGDSICRGFLATKPFTTVVAERLGITTINIDNNGIDSSTIAQSANNPISARMSQLSPADLILFEGGGNDFNLIPAALGAISDTTNVTFYGALNVCAKYLREKFPFSTIVWVTVPRWSNWSTLNSQSLNMDAYMDAFKAVAVRNGFFVADGYTKMSIANYPYGAMISNDYAHLNDIGHQLLADVILDAIGR